jgi:filamentous hemagglutinin family protein
MKSKARQLWHKKSVIAVAVGLVCSHHAMGAGPVAQKALPLVQNARPKTPLPSGMSVVSGNANAQQSGNTLTVNNSANAVLNWQQFSVASGHAVHFQQPSAACQVLNRVVGQDPSYILGNLSSNGGVWLLNLNGVLFGADARINVQGLVASDLWTTGAGFGGKTTLTSTGNNASFGVINQGNIRTAYGGQVVLAGTSVQNLGQIHAPGGQAALLAANAVELTDTALPYLSFKVPLPSGTASNSGTV